MKSQNLIRFSGAIILFILTTGLTNSMDHERIQLPAPRLDSDFSVEQALQNRRSIREYSNEQISLTEISQLLWACQGLTKILTVPAVGTFRLRTAPSAGALYPLEIYLVSMRVESIGKGVFHYLPGSELNDHALTPVRMEDVQDEFVKATLEQSCVKDCAAAIVITSINQRVAVKYGERAERYCLLEAGHAAQNVCLQAQAFEVGVATVGAFHDDKLQDLLQTEAVPSYLLCLGKMKK